MGTQRTNMLSVAAGVGVGVVLFDLLLRNPVGEAVLRGVAAAIITALLVTLFERGGRRS